ncbi:ComEC family competence protein [Acetobacteraceae bacterium]|nr:ComEC family competence protein [Acetobacteraceae bacterium]
MWFGLGSACYFELSFEPSLLFLYAFGGIALTFIGLAIFSIKTNLLFEFIPETLRTWIIFVFVLFLASVTGFLGAAFQAHQQTPFPNVPNSAVTVEGILAAAEYRSGDLPEAHFWRLKIRNPILDRPLDQGMKPLSRYFDISWKSSLPVPELGSKIRLRTLLYLPSQPAIPNGYDPQRYAFFSGLGGRGRALDAPIILEKPRSSVFRQMAYHWDGLRNLVALKTRSVLKDSETASVAEILLCGKEGDLSQSLRNAFAASGLAHILAVAGLHLGMVTAFVSFLSYFILSRFEWVLLRFSAKRMAALIGLMAGAGYIFFTGSHLPGLRALGVASLAILAFQFGRTPFSLRSLAFVALGFEIFSPAIVLDAGFQMSFCAVMALGAGYRALIPVTYWLQTKGGLGKYIFLPLFGLFMTSMIAGLAVMPSVLARFGFFQPWFVLANLVAVPLMGMWVMPLAICALVAMFFGLEEHVLLLMGKGIEYIILSANYASHLPAASLPVPATPGWALAISILGLSLLCLSCGRKRYFGLIAICFGVSVPFFLPKPFLLFSNSGKVSAIFQKDHFEVFTFPKGENKNEKKFTLENWEGALGLKKGGYQQFSCEGEGNCLKIFSGKKIALVGLGRDLEEEKLEISNLCNRADLLVSFIYGTEKCPHIFTLTPSMTWQEGSFSVWINYKGALEMQSDIDARGKRLWVYPSSRAGFPNIPLAPAE